MISFPQSLLKLLYQEIIAILLHLIHVQILVAAPAEFLLHYLMLLDRGPQISPPPPPPIKIVHALKINSARHETSRVGQLIDKNSLVP